MTCLQDCKSVRAEHATYMIRYKDNDTYRSAWRYSYVDSPIFGEGKILKIESVPVKASLTIDQLNKDYFALSKVRKYVKTIYLPATGSGYEKDGSGRGESRGSWAYYWSATTDSRYQAYNMRFTGSEAHVRVNSSSGNYAVRPFRNL